MIDWMIEANHIISRVIKSSYQSWGRIVGLMSLFYLWGRGASFLVWCRDGWPEAIEENQLRTIRLSNLPSIFLKLKMGPPISIIGCVRPSVGHLFFKCQKWTIFFMKIIGTVQLWHCWMCLLFWMCWMCWMCWMWLRCPRTHRWAGGPCLTAKTNHRHAPIHHLL